MSRVVYVLWRSVCDSVRCVITPSRSAMINTDMTASCHTSNNLNDVRASLADAIARFTASRRLSAAVMRCGDDVEEGDDGGNIDGACVGAGSDTGASAGAVVGAVCEMIGPTCGTVGSWSINRVPAMVAWILARVTGSRLDKTSIICCWAAFISGCFSFWNMLVFVGVRMGVNKGYEVRGVQ